MNPLLIKAGKWAVVAGAVVAVLFLMSWCQGRNWQTKTDALTKENDSLKVVVAVRTEQSRAHEERADSLVVEVAVALDSAQKATATANRLRASRVVIRPVPSVPGTAPTTRDSLAAALAALNLAVEETDALRVAIRQDSTAMAAARRTEAELRGALALERTTVADLMAGNRKLSDQLASAAPPCRILLWGCPSRTVVAVGTALGTYLIVRR